MSSRIPLALVAWSLLVPGFALAQPAPVPGFELERIRLNAGAAQGLLVESGDLLPRFQYRAAVTFHLEHNPLVLYQDGKSAGALVSNRIGLHVSGAFSATDWLEVSLQLPIVLHQSRDDLAAQGYSGVFTGAAAGTPWVGARAAVLQERNQKPVDLTFGVSLGLPLGSQGALTADQTLSAVPSVGVGRTVTSFLRIGGSVSVLIRNARHLTPGSTTDQVYSFSDYRRFWRLWRGSRRPPHGRLQVSRAPRDGNGSPQAER
jgi:hypothetical protein